VSLRLPGSREKHTVYVHRAVCEAFHGSPPEGGHHAHHINGFKDDNRWDNLCWVESVNQNHPDPVGTDKYPQEEEG